MSFYNFVDLVQGPKATRGRMLQGKRHHSEQDDNVIKMQGVTRSDKERKDYKELET